MRRTRQSLESWEVTCRRHRDAARGDAEAGRIAEHVEYSKNGVDVVQRLTHSHEDDVQRVRRSRSARPKHDEELPDDLARREMAPETHGAGRTERAPHRTADLAR